MSAKEGMSSTRMVHFSDSAATEEPREVEIIATNDNALNEEDSSASVKLHGEVDANTTSAKSKGVTGYWSKLSGLFLPNKDDDDEEKNEDDDERDDDEEISSRRQESEEENGSNRWTKVSEKFKSNENQIQPQEKRGYIQKPLNHAVLVVLPNEVV